MRKILAILGSVGVSATATLTVVACGRNSQYNTFKNYVNETKGSYDQQGRPTSKSSASVVYVGAQDNGSSLSFEYALKNVFEDVESARRVLSQETKITTTNPYSFNAVDIKNGEFNLSKDQAKDLVGSNWLKIEVDSKTYDGAITDGKPGKYNISFEDLKISGKKTVQITGYKQSKPTVDPNVQSVVDQWNNAYWQWLGGLNPDRALTGMEMNLNPKSKKFGQVTNTKKEDPVYGIKNLSDVGTITNALDYSKVKLGLKTMTVKKVADYWNESFFNTLVDNYLRTDLLYQLTVNSHPTENENKREYQARVKIVDDYITEIKKAKGPLFFVIKNGHLLKVVRGWNRYAQYGSKNPTEAHKYQQDLTSLAVELGDIFKKSFVENNQGLFVSGASKEVATWKLATDDDKGATNWDPKKNLPTS